MWPDQSQVRARRRYMDVAEAIASAVSTGRFGPGSRLPSDRELAQQFGVSRPTAREGLLALEYAGLIEIRPGSGAYVSDQRLDRAATVLKGVESPTELIEARLAVEPLIARYCAGRASEEQVAGVRSLVDRAGVEAAPDGDATVLVRLGLEFHRELANSCGNSLLGGFCTSLVSAADHPLWVLLNSQAMRAAEARRAQVDEHRQIVEAIAARDAHAAFEAMQAHLKRVSEQIGAQGGVL